MLLRHKTPLFCNPPNTRVPTTTPIPWLRHKTPRLCDPPHTRLPTLHSYLGYIVADGVPMRSFQPFHLDDFAANRQYHSIFPCFHTQHAYNLPHFVCTLVTMLLMACHCARCSHHSLSTLRLRDIPFSFLMSLFTDDNDRSRKRYKVSSKK